MSDQAKQQAKETKKLNPQTQWFREKFFPGNTLFFGRQK